MKIGITGAAGFIGKALAARAAAEGHDVVGLDLSPTGETYFQNLGARYITGDITNADHVNEFSNGLQRVYHTAAIVKEDGDWKAFERVNVDASHMLAQTAKLAGVQAFVHFSSVMVYGFDFADGVTETGPLDAADNPYCWSKIESEKAVLQCHQPGKFDVYIIRPGDVYGPGSVPWTLRPVQMMKSRRWVFVESRRATFNHVYVENLLDGIELILEKKASGRPFNITDGARTTVRDFFSAYQNFLGIQFIPDLPAAVALPIASLVGRIAGAVGVDAGMNRQAVRYMLRRHAYSSEAIQMLGYRPRIGLPEGMEECRRWLAAEGLLGKAAAAAKDMRVSGRVSASERRSRS
jgi:nucleoside-diphosphate-sugar epimerase